VQKIGCDVVGHYDYDAYAKTDDDILTTEDKQDNDIVREIRNIKLIQNKKNKKIKRRRQTGKKKKSRGANSHCE
jgi:hypothetical protein